MRGHGRPRPAAFAVEADVRRCDRGDGEAVLGCRASLDDVSGSPTEAAKSPPFTVVHGLRRLIPTGRDLLPNQERALAERLTRLSKRLKWRPVAAVDAVEPQVRWRNLHNERRDAAAVVALAGVADWWGVTVRDDFFGRTTESAQAPPFAVVADPIDVAVTAGHEVVTYDECAIAERLAGSHRTGQVGGPGAAAAAGEANVRRCDLDDGSGPESREAYVPHAGNVIVGSRPGPTKPVEPGQAPPDAAAVGGPVCAIAAGFNLGPDEVRAVAGRLAGRDDRRQAGSPGSTAEAAERSVRGGDINDAVAGLQVVEPPADGAPPHPEAKVVSPPPVAVLQVREGCRAVAAGQDVDADAVLAVTEGRQRGRRRRGRGRGRGCRRGRGRSRGRRGPRRGRAAPGCRRGRCSPRRGGDHGGRTRGDRRGRR